MIQPKCYILAWCVLVRVNVQSVMLSVSVAAVQFSMGSYCICVWESYAVWRSIPVTSLPQSPNTDGSSCNSHSVVQHLTAPKIHTDITIERTLSV